VLLEEVGGDLEPIDFGECSAQEVGVDAGSEEVDRGVLVLFTEPVGEKARGIFGLVVRFGEALRGTLAPVATALTRGGLASPLADTPWEEAAFLGAHRRNAAC
jgi:hypothetical protein